MKVLIALILFSILNTFGQNSYASDGLYLAPQIGMIYNASSKDAYASSLGNKVGLLGGKRFGNMALESGIARTALNNTNGGDTKYRSEYTNDLYFIGLRLFLSENFSFNGGLISHNLDCTVKDKNGKRLKSKEENGSYTSYYLGMGMQHSLNNEMDLYWESNLTPINEIDFFQVEVLFGIRIYL